MSKKTTRRELLINTAASIGGVTTFSMLLPGGGLLATPAIADTLVDPLAPKPTHFPAKVKSVVWLHQFGAPSSLDLYDYKPELIKRAGPIRVDEPIAPARYRPGHRHQPTRRR